MRLFAIRLLAIKKTERQKCVKPRPDEQGYICTNPHTEQKRGVNCRHFCIRTNANRSGLNKDVNTNVLTDRHTDKHSYTISFRFLFGFNSIHLSRSNVVFCVCF